MHLVVSCGIVFVTAQNTQVALLAVTMVVERSPAVLMQTGYMYRPPAQAIRIFPGQQLAVGGVDIEGGQGESDALFGSHDDHSTYGIPILFLWLRIHVSVQA